MLPIFTTLWIFNLGSMIMEANIIRVIILTITITATIMAINHGEKSVIFVNKKVIALIIIQTMSYRRQKNFENKTENFVEIKANIIYFCLIMKAIQMMILIVLMKKQII